MNWTKLTFLTLGITILLPWNLFIIKSNLTAAHVFQNKSLSTVFHSLIIVTSQILTIIINVWFIFNRPRQNMKIIYVCLMLMIFLGLCFDFLNFLNLSSDWLYFLCSFIVLTALFITSAFLNSAACLHVTFHSSHYGEILIIGNVTQDLFLNL